MVRKDEDLLVFCVHHHPERLAELVYTVVAHEYAARLCLVIVQGHLPKIIIPKDVLFGQITQVLSLEVLKLDDMRVGTPRQTDRVFINIDGLAIFCYAELLWSFGPI